MRSGVRERVLVVDGGFFGDRFVKIARAERQAGGAAPDSAGAHGGGRRTRPVAHETQGGRRRAGPLGNQHRGAGALGGAGPGGARAGGRGPPGGRGDEHRREPGGNRRLGAGLRVHRHAEGAGPAAGDRTGGGQPTDDGTGRRAQGEPGWYFDLVLHEEAIKDDQPTQTPCIPLYLALECQLRRIEAEGGVEARWARHRAMLRMMEEWVAAHPEWAFFAPEGRRSLDRLGAQAAARAEPAVRWWPSWPGGATLSALGSTRWRTRWCGSGTWAT